MVWVCFQLGFEWVLLYFLHKAGNQSSQMPNFNAVFVRCYENPLEQIIFYFRNVRLFLTYL